MKFLEYLNAKGKLQEKPITAINADYEGPEENFPEPNDIDDLGYKVPKPIKKTPVGYSPKSNIGKKDLEKGVAYSGDKDMVINFPELGKMNNEQFINATKSLPTEEFIKVMNEHCGCEKKSAPMVVAYSSGSYHPDPIQAIRYVSYLANENENLLRALIHESKKMGGLEKICERLMEYSEFYEVLKHKINDSSIFESVKKNIIENNRINEIKKNEEDEEDEEDEHEDEDEADEDDEDDEDKPKRKHKIKKGDEDEEDELTKIETEKGESNMKLMKKRSKKK